MVRQYIGARYVPRFVGTHNITQRYEALDVVDNGMGTSYIAKKPTPARTPLTNTDYWYLYGSTSGAIVNLQQQINDMKDGTIDGSLQDQINDSNLRITTQGTTIDNLDLSVQGLSTNVSTLSSGLTSEIAARQSADTTETLAREAADTALGARIDQIIAPSGEAPSAAEVADARVGVDGITYNSLGAAIRGQVGDIRDALTPISKIPYPKSIIDLKNHVVEVKKNYRWDKVSGEMVSEPGYVASLIEVTGGEVYSFNYQITSTPTFSFLSDIYDNYVEDYDYNDLHAIGNGYYFIVPDNVKYIKFTSGNITYYDNLVVMEGQKDISTYSINDYPVDTTLRAKCLYPLELADGTVINTAPPKVFYCGSTRALNTLKGAIEEATKYMDSIVYVDAGTYDLVTEFGQSYLDNVTGTDNIGITLKNRVHVIFSSGSKVVFNYTGSNEVVHEYFSPFMSGEYGFTLENAYVNSKNCRYAMHDERATSADDYHNVYKRCTFIHDSSDASGWHAAQALGGGLGVHGDILIEDCYMTSRLNDDTISYHNPNIQTPGSASKSNLVIKNTYTSGTICMIELGSSTEKTRAIITNCSLRIAPKITQSTVHNMEIIDWNNNIRES